MGFLDGFSPLAFSCEIGSVKPEPEASAWILDRLQLPAGQVAFVDDRLENIETAAALGIRAVWHRGDAEATARQLFELAGIK